MKNQITQQSFSSPLPSHEEIAQLAYLFFEEDGYQHGHDLEDWFRAEKELSPKSLGQDHYYSGARATEQFRARIEA